MPERLQYEGLNLRPEVLAYLGLGANLGEAQTAVMDAVQAIAGLPETRLAQVSSLYRSAPVEATGPDYINAVCGVWTRLTAPDLLLKLQQIEHDAGRQRPYRNAPRTLDIDVLLYGDARMDSPALVLPHPRLTSRAFVLKPLAEIAPELVNPAQLAAVAMQKIGRL